MKYYLILDKTNKVVGSFKNKKMADDYIAIRPYLKIDELETSSNHDGNDNLFTP